MATATTKREVATATDRPQQNVPPPAAANGSDIARRAYELYVARGGEDGHDVEDWLQAERELMVDAEC
jgi:hypothetical protein